MVALGILYAAGVGVEQNQREARRWFRLANAHGYPMEDELLAHPEQIFHIVLQQDDTRPRDVLPAPTSAEVLDPNDNASVMHIQRQLSALGYNTGPIDGMIGPMTRNAIKGFQKDHGLPVNGEATHQTIQVLNSMF